VAGEVLRITRFCAISTSSRNSAASRENSGGLFGGHFLVAFARLHQAQVAYVARERHLRGGDALLRELVSDLLLRVDALAADQLQDLALR